jgi:dTDP-4-dehydrorhamnose 3,5-epimerase-like enzyme
MIKINIFNDTVDGLQKFEDDRGIIADIFYKKPLEHVALIKSEPNVIRGNHYHKETTQHMLMTQGSMEYWYKNLNDSAPAKMILLKRGDLVTTPPKEIHALKIGNDGNEFIVFSSGLRGGQDYESDTYRVETIID